MPLVSDPATQLIKDYVQKVWVEKRFESVNEFFTPYPKVQTPLGEFDGLETVKKYIKTYVEAFSEMKIEILEIISQNNRVALNWKISGTCTNFFGIEGNKKKASIWGNTLYFLENNKVNEVRMCGNLYGLLVQLGAIPDVFKKK